ncbi:MAG TPA: MOSC domain-containing protein [Acidimicrobiia bacterium]|jgi:MOSC domain-containing protein YiiM
MSIGKVHQVSVSNGGVPKNAVASAQIHRIGVEGDSQRDTENHGGPDRAVCLFSWDLIQRLQDEGHPIEPGWVGENLTVSGIDWDLMAPGRRLRIGDEVEIELTSYTNPCSNVAASFINGHFGRIRQGGHPGWSRVYARVLAEGRVAEGDAVELLD